MTNQRQRFVIWVPAFAGMSGDFLGRFDSDETQPALGQN
jgi:hypothetical protein